MEPIIAAVLLGLLLGGSLLNLSRLQFRYMSLILIAYLIQVGIDFLAAKYGYAVSPIFHIISYLLLLFALAANRRIAGVWLLLAGTVLNFVVIVLNGGQMPVKGDQLTGAMADALAAGLGGTHVLLDAAARLPFLADVVFLPVFYHPRMVSVGDLVLNAGLIILVIKGMKAGHQQASPQGVSQTP